jgi:hypothetical protein
MRHEVEAGYVVVAVAPDPAPVRSCGRAASRTRRPRSLTAEQEAEIRALAQTRSLRSLAADFGVSHETVRRAIREGETAVA